LSVTNSATQAAKITHIHTQHFKPGCFLVLSPFVLLWETKAFHILCFLELQLFSILENMLLSTCYAVSQLDSLNSQRKYLYRSTRPPSSDLTANYQWRRQTSEPWSTLGLPTSSRPSTMGSWKQLCSMLTVDQIF